MDERRDNRIQRLRAYIWEHGPVTRSDIASSLKINLPAVSKVTAALLAEKRLVATGQEDSTGGRKAWRLDVPADEGSVVALSFSSRGIASALSDMKTRLTNRRSTTFALSASAEELLETIQDQVREQLDYRTQHNLPEVQGLGIALSGLVDEAEGVSISFPRLENWREVPLRRLLEEQFDLPVALGNRIYAVTRAEAIFGRQRGRRDFLYVHLGPGIGLGICLNGQVHRGAHSSAGELGHVTVEESGKLCYCGNYGCLETVASDRALIDEAVRGLKDGVESRIPEFADKQGEVGDAAIFAAAEAGDRFANQLVRNIGRALGAAIANQINIFGPECLILGGAISCPVLNSEIERTLKQRVLGRLERNLELVPGSFAQDEGLKGAATLALWNHYN